MDSVNAIGVIGSITMPFAIMALASILSKLGATAETSRKVVHILVSNWIIIAFAVYRSPWTASLIPAFFVVFNYFSATKGIFPAMERSKEESTLGTFWYAISLLLLTILGFVLKKPWVAMSGMLAMGYGDGFAGLIGEYFGKHHFTGRHSKKTLEGTIAAMLFSGVSVGVVCFCYRNHTSDLLFVYAAISCSILSGVIELLTPRGLDNITLPLIVALVVYLLDVSPEAWTPLLSLNVGFIVLLAGYYLKAITVEAFLVAAVMGFFIHLFGGWLSFCSLILFFCIGSIVSVIGKREKRGYDFVNEHHGPRVIAQVLANAMPALIFSVLYYFTNNDVFLLAVIICFAADSADTFSSELGMLSGRQPVSIITFKPIQRGLSGGVTTLGFAGAFIGAFCISLIAYPHFGIWGQVIVVIAGLFDSVLDSVLGAAFQAKYICRTNEEARYTERQVLDGSTLELIHGYRWMNNDMVNFLSVLTTGTLFSIICSLLYCNLRL